MSPRLDIDALLASCQFHHLAQHNPRASEFYTQGAGNLALFQALCEARLPVSARYYHAKLAYPNGSDTYLVSDFMLLMQGELFDCMNHRSLPQALEATQASHPGMPLLEGRFSTVKDMLHIYGDDRSMWPGQKDRVGMSAEMADIFLPPARAWVNAQLLATPSRHPPTRRLRL